MATTRYTVLRVVRGTRPVRLVACQGALPLSGQHTVLNTQPLCSMQEVCAGRRGQSGMAKFSGMHITLITSPCFAGSPQLGPEVHCCAQWLPACGDFSATHSPLLNATAATFPLEPMFRAQIYIQTASLRGGVEALHCVLMCSKGPAAPRCHDAWHLQ